MLRSPQQGWQLLLQPGAACWPTSPSGSASGALQASACNVPCWWSSCALPQAQQPDGGTLSPKMTAPDWHGLA